MRLHLFVRADVIVQGCIDRQVAFSFITFATYFLKTVLNLDQLFNRAEKPLIRVYQ